ncbi:MAG: hypothetical protein M0R80_01100 [Proteobacteria bacterium]|jgi:hypothetical protein|nr:hypothetical protein [Pseudomonadota bacterium]
MAKKTDQKTLDLIKEVKRRKEEISKIEKPNWITNCSFGYIEGNVAGRTNIHVEASVKNLIGMAAFLMDKERTYATAAAAMEVDAPLFTWDGFSVSDWVADIKARINKVQIASKKKSLETLEGRLNAIISPELRAELELEAIAGELG